jgi:hypothetical protein
MKREPKKFYESKKLYSKKYNKSHSTIQIDRNLYDNLKEFLNEENISIKDFVTDLIKKSISSQ